MKINNDLIRELMLFSENSLDMVTDLIFYDEIKSFAEKSEFTLDQVNYHLWELDNAGFLDVNFNYANNGISSVTINNVLWDGHQFLDTIRDPKVWKTTKTIASKLESISVTVLSTIGSNVLKHYIDKQMGY